MKNELRAHCHTFSRLQIVVEQEGFEVFGFVIGLACAIFVCDFFFFFFFFFL
jgi:hypothetical protein